MKVIYVAGPFRGTTAWQIECNIRRAEELGLEVSRLGAVPLIPHSNTRFFHGEGSDAFWLEATLELLRRCDALVTTQDWQRSTGARGEVGEMRQLGRPVFHSLGDLDEWLTRVGI